MDFMQQSIMGHCFSAHSINGLLLLLSLKSIYLLLFASYLCCLNALVKFLWWHNWSDITEACLRDRVLIHVLLFRIFPFSLFIFLLSQGVILLQLCALLTVLRAFCFLSVWLLKWLHWSTFGKTIALNCFNKQQEVTFITFSVYIGHS